MRMWGRGKRLSDGESDGWSSVDSRSADNGAAWVSGEPWTAVDKEADAG